MSSGVLLHVGGVYAEMHDRVFGWGPRVEPIQIGGLTPALVEEARRAWQERFQREYRALQNASRFLTEVTGAGEPYEVQVAVLDLLRYRMRRVRLSTLACESFGAAPVLPNPLVADEPWPNADAPMLERAVATAIACLGIEDTIRTFFVEDLAARCRTTRICHRLAEVLEGKELRERFAWTYVREGIRRFPPSFLAEWRHLVEVTLAPYQRRGEEVLAQIPEDQRTLEAWPEPERASVGIFSPVRQALLFNKVYSERILPRLREAELS